MGRRSRKRRELVTAPETPAAAREERKPRLSSEERNQLVREGLEPLAPGERPGAVTVAAILAAILAIANITLAIAGYEVEGSSGVGGGIMFSLILAVAAVGMWMARYWAVLGFQALLALTACVAVPSLFFATSVRQAALALVTSVGSAWLFYKLIRAMARLQMPERPARRS